MMAFNEGGKVNFPGPIGTKRRRMRSGGNVSTVTNNGVPSTVTTTNASSAASTSKPEENVSEEKTTQTSKCKGATTIPIFLKSKCCYKLQQLGWHDPTKELLILLVMPRN